MDRFVNAGGSFFVGTCGPSDGFWLPPGWAFFEANGPKNLYGIKVGVIMRGLSMDRFKVCQQYTERRGKPNPLMQKIIAVSGFGIMCLCVSPGNLCALSC